MENINEQPVQKVAVKKIGSQVASQLDVAKKYYSLISTIYNIPLTEMETNLMAHTAVWGTISTPPARDAFVEDYKSSKASLNNMISKLQQKGVLYKDEQLKIRIVPALRIRMDRTHYQFTINLDVKDAA